MKERLYSMEFYEAFYEQYMNKCLDLTDVIEIDQALVLQSLEIDLIQAKPHSP